MVFVEGSPTEIRIHHMDTNHRLTATVYFWQSSLRRYIEKAVKSL